MPRTDRGVVARTFERLALMTDRRRVLFVSYYTEPRTDVAVRRSAQIMKYLPSCGWNVTTLTAAAPEPRTESASLIETPYVEVRSALKRALGISNSALVARQTDDTRIRGVRITAALVQRLLRLAYVCVTYPDLEVGWLPYLVRALRSAIRRERYDAILSSAPPHITNIAIAMAKDDTPWVADLRDLWTGVDYYGRSHVRAFLDDRLERFSLRKARVLTSVSEPMAEYLAQRYPAATSLAIPNAYDEDEWRGVPFGTSAHCTLLFGGQLYGGRGDFDVLFAALRSLLDERNVTESQLRLHFYTLREAWLSAAIAKYRLQDIVELKGLVPRAQFMEAARRADRLLIVLWDGAGADGILRGRLFEYLGARRPILVVGGPPRSAIDSVLGETGAGRRCRDVGAVKEEIMRAVHGYREGGTQVIAEERLSSYGAQRLAERFDVALRTATGERLK